MELSDLGNKHAGRIGIVAGAGPSLLAVDPKMLKDLGVVISVNSSISKLTNADYFIADDIGVRTWDYYRITLPKIDATCLLYRKKLAGEANHIPKERVIYFDHKWWYDPGSKKYNPEGLILTKDPKAPLVGARTSAGTAVHFAYIMGCDPIVLVGCDCCYKQSKRYFWQFPGEKPCKRLTGEKVFCHNNRGTHKGYAVDSHSMDFIEYWTAFAKANPDVNIIDASDGTLECFKKMSLQEVQEEYGGVFDRK